MTPLLVLDVVGLTPRLLALHESSYTGGTMGADHPHARSAELASRR